MNESDESSSAASPRPLSQSETRLKPFEDEPPASEETESEDSKERSRARASAGGEVSGSTPLREIAAVRIAAPPVSIVPPADDSKKPSDDIALVLTEAAPLNVEAGYVDPRRTLADFELAPDSLAAASRRLELVADADDHTSEQEDAVRSSSPMLAEADELVGQLVDARYRIEGVLGVGSMGIVYVARHLAVGKRVALKVLRQQYVQDAEVTQRFTAEATAATAIGNAHIVDTLDFGKLANGSAYQVMELLEGHMLSQALQEEPRLPLERILHIARQVAVGLGAAHEAGIVHRDLKPDNVFLIHRGNTADFVKILDFGIAKFGGGQNNLTQAGAVFGTPNYMAPEQAMGKPTDPCTDVYALGVILYEMASGIVPFSGDSPIAVLTQHATEAPLPLGRRVTGLPPRFQSLVARCLAKEPSARFASMQELVDELDAVALGEDWQEVPAPMRPEHASADHSAALEAARTSRLGWTVGSVAAILALLLAGYAALARFRRPAPRPAAAVVAAPPSPVSSAAPSEPPPKLQNVALVLFPLDAHAVLGDRDLGAMPVTVPVPEGHPVSVEIRRDGYWPRRLRLDGTKTRLVVGLVKRGTSAAPPPDAVDDAKPAAKGATPAGQPVATPTAGSPIY